ncbi:hypothetical protein CK203_002087 [Vitis vinifera]|uniref:Mitochondrial protein n=1 Tax=Vitis vinifera TaxID=29760 RepID=A0A438KK40_VITVI|nr:hypothetical protein CK203_002087 [Vitis vinifera]
MDFLKEIGKLVCRLASTPIDLNHKLREAEENAAVDRNFMHNPKEVHRQVANMVLQYPKESPGRGILFKQNIGLVLEAYTDADYAGSVVDKRSTIEYCTFLGGNLVTWRS